MLLESGSCQLVLIDYQEKLMPAISGGEDVLKNAVRLAQIAKKLHIPIYGTEQLPEKLGKLPKELSSLCKSVLVKSHFSACPDGLIDLLERPAQKSGNARSLPKHLQNRKTEDRNVYVLAGVEAHVCLLQTALDMLNAEMDVWVVVDACGSRTDRNRDAAFDRLASCGAELITTEMALFEWLGSADHPEFKNMQALIK